MKKSDFLLIVGLACFICGIALFIIFLIFREDWLLYSTIPFAPSAILIAISDRKNSVQKKIKR